MSTKYDTVVFCIYCNIEVFSADYVETDKGPAHKGCVEQVEEGGFVQLC